MGELAVVKNLRIRESGEFADHRLAERRLHLVRDDGHGPPAASFPIKAGVRKERLHLRDAEHVNCRGMGYRFLPRGRAVAGQQYSRSYIGCAPTKSEREKMHARHEIVRLDREPEVRALGEIESGDPCDLPGKLLFSSVRLPRCFPLRFRAECTAPSRPILRAAWCAVPSPRYALG